VFIFGRNSNHLRSTTKESFVPVRSDIPSVRRSAQSELDRLETDLAELAAGVLGRREEAAVLDHLASCPNCAAEFVRLAAAAKSLLSLVREIDPPVGFEGRFWDRIDTAPF
jgi:hypothetical protein